MCGFGSVCMLVFLCVYCINVCAYKCVRCHMSNCGSQFLIFTFLCILSIQVCSCVRMMNISGGSNKSCTEMYRRK